MKTVIVKRLAGETGLRLPGTKMEVSDAEAARLIKLGLVFDFKELKQPRETKELKVKRTTKERK